MQSSTNVGCYGGSDGTANISVTGGTSPFNYTWTDVDAAAVIDAGVGIITQTGLQTGTYLVSVVDDNNCSDNFNFTIAQPDTVIQVLQKDSTTATCSYSSDGTATVVGDGGVGSFTYLWDIQAASQTNSTATGLVAGSYEVTITDGNGCTGVFSQTVTSPISITLSSSITSPSCAGDSDGQASVASSSSAIPNVYQWDTNANNQTNITATGLLAGSYSVTATDNDGCEVQATISPI